MREHIYARKEDSYLTVREEKCSSDVPFLHILGTPSGKGVILVIVTYQTILLKMRV